MSPVDALAALLGRLPRAILERRELQPLLHFLGRATSPDARAAYHQTLTKNLRRQHELAVVRDAASAAGLTWIVVKGAALAETLYPDLGTRPMHDVDILVGATDLDRSVALLELHGFERAQARVPRFDATHAHDIAMRSPNLYIELHHALFHELELDGEQASLIARAQDGMLALDDHLMLVALHAATHAFGDSPLWLVDTALLLAAGADRQAARTNARARGGGPAFDAALHLFDHPQGLASLLLAAPPSQLTSLLIRGALVDGHRRRARWLWRKLALRATELVSG